ncbi:DUF3530 family protein [Marinospirillum perlucidum]|uniref:DUF3530 family protein n=1 Tax=Marinospirillum perlucidum TaxID=1982602 RepID=UPI000DF19131|nr:DUF3530 family protein [Marinospirillum perlucidum]
MKGLLIALFLLAFILPPVGAAGLPPGFGEEEESEEDQAPERADVNYQQLQLNALLKQVDDQEVLYLPLDEDREFLTLQRQGLSANPKGRLLLLPADGQHPDNPLGLASLRRQLPDYGWSTLALALPNYKPLGPPPRTLPPGPLLTRMDNNPEPAEDEGSEEENPASAFGGAFGEEEEEEEAPPPERADPAERLAEHRVQILERVEAALAHPFADPSRQVLVLQGESLFWILPWLEEGNWPARAPLVLLNLQVPEGADLQTAIRVLQELGRQPLLDIYSSEQPAQARAAEERRRAYLRAGNDLAVQLPVRQETGVAARGMNTWLVQRVEGWLRSLN